MRIFSFFIMITCFLQSGYSYQKFTKVLTGQIVNDGGDSHGVAFGDYNKDGFTDIFISNLSEEVDFLYKNNRDGTFRRVNIDAIDNKELNTACATWVDYNNDGNLDLFLAVGSTLEPQQNVLYKNDGNESFSVVEQNLLGDLITFKGSTESIAWGDVDNDGDLDMFEVNWRVQPNLLYINNGRGIFSYDTISGITNDYDWAITANWIDYNKDNKNDLFVARQGYPINGGKGKSYLLSNHNSLYTGGEDNSISNTFDQYDPLVSTGGNSITSSWGDINNDGYLDVFVGNFDNQGNFLFINNKNGSFTKIQDSPVVNDKAFSVGSSFGDIDNDGDLDLFVSNGYDNNKQKNFLYLNDGEGQFKKITKGDIVNDKIANVANAMVDYDNDGDLDVFVVSRSGENNLLYRNEANNNNNWIKIKCIGSETNVNGLGVKIEVRYIDGDKEKFQYREINQLTGYGAHGEFIAHFGLGKLKEISEVTISWPTGEKQKFKNVQTNQYYIAYEKSIELKKLVLKTK